VRDCLSAYTSRLSLLWACKMHSQVKVVSMDATLEMNRVTCNFRKEKGRWLRSRLASCFSNAQSNSGARPCAVNSQPRLRRKTLHPALATNPHSGPILVLDQTQSKSHREWPLDELPELASAQFISTIYPGCSCAKGRCHISFGTVATCDRIDFRGHVGQLRT
jgi:hypothetical protein